MERGPEASSSAIPKAAAVLTAWDIQPAVVIWSIQVCGESWEDPGCLTTAPSCRWSF
jgi:hypothetical protein